MFIGGNITETDKKDIRLIFNEGIQQLVLPILDDIYEKMATKEDLKKMATKDDINDLANHIDNIDRKLDAEIWWRDRAEKRIKKVEAKLA